MNTARPIVGLCGPALSGKDTLAKCLLRRGWYHGAFAAAVKRDLEPALGRPFVSLTPAEKEFWRPLMVCYAELRRKRNAAHWIGELQAHLCMRVEPRRPVVITDVRYANEIEWIRRQGGLVVLLLRPGITAANPVEKRHLVACAKLIPAGNTIINVGPVSGGRKCLLELVRRHYGKVVRYV